MPSCPLPIKLSGGLNKWVPCTISHTYSVGVLSKTYLWVSIAPRGALCCNAGVLVLVFIQAVGGCHGVPWVLHHPEWGTRWSALWCFFSSSIYWGTWGTLPGEGWPMHMPRHILLLAWKTSKALTQELEAVLVSVHQIHQHHHLPTVVRPLLLGELSPGNLPALLAAVLTT